MFESGSNPSNIHAVNGIEFGVFLVTYFVPIVFSLIVVILLITELLKKMRRG